MHFQEYYFRSVIPSFVLMDIQSSTVVTYVYQLVDDEGNYQHFMAIPKSHFNFMYFFSVKVERIEYKKN